MSKDTSEIKAEKHSKHDLGRPAWIMFATLSIFVVTQIVAVLIAGVLALIFSSGPFSVSAISDSAAAQFVYILLAEAMIIAIVMWLVRRRGLSLANIGFGRRPTWADLGRAAAAFGVFVISLIVITAIISGFWHGYNTDQLQDVGFKTSISGTDKLIAFISLVFLPPIGEETLMRGYLYSGLRARWSFVGAGLATSVLFGAAHLLTGQNGLLWAAAVDTFVLSLFLVYLREKTGALYAGMGLHALNNVLAFFVYFHS